MASEIVVSLSARNATPSFVFPERRLRFKEDNVKVSIGRASSTVQKGFIAARSNAWFDSPVMSRNHAELIADIDARLVLVQDIGSLHGTWLNSQRLDPDRPKVLTSGDTLKFGTEILRNGETFPACSVEIQIEFEASGQNVFRVPDESDAEGDDVQEIDQADSSDVEEISPPSQPAIITSSARTVKAAPVVIDLSRDDNTSVVPVPPDTEPSLRPRSERAIEIDDGPEALPASSVTAGDFTLANDNENFAQLADTARFPDPFNDDDDEDSNYSDEEIRLTDLEQDSEEEGSHDFSAADSDIDSEDDDSFDAGYSSPSERESVCSQESESGASSAAPEVFMPHESLYTPEPARLFYSELPALYSPPPQTANMQTVQSPTLEASSSAASHPFPGAGAQMAMPAHTTWTSMFDTVPGEPRVGPKPTQKEDVNEEPLHRINHAQQQGPFYLSSAASATKCPVKDILNPEPNAMEQPRNLVPVSAAALATSSNRESVSDASEEILLFPARPTVQARTRHLGRSFVYQPMLDEQYPLSDVRHESPDLDMSSAFAFEQSKKTATEAKAQGSYYPAMIYELLENSLPERSEKQKEKAVATAPVTPPAVTSANLKRKRDELDRLDAEDEVLTTAASTLPSPPIESPAVAPVDKRDTATVVAPVQMAVVRGGDQPAAVVTVPTKSEERPLKRLRLFAEKAGYAAAGAAAAGVALFSVLIATAPAI